MRGRGWGIALAISVFTLCALVGRGIHTRHDFFVPLATSFIQGRLSVPMMRGELHEMVSATEVRTGIFREPVDGVPDQYYVIYPPLPAILAIPFVLIGGETTNQSAISWIYFAISVLVLWRLLGALQLAASSRGWLTAFYMLGSTVWYHALVGSAWYFAQVVALLTTFLALWSVVRRQPPWVTGIWVGCMYLSRYNLILAAPAFLYLVLKAGQGWRRALAFLVPVTLSVLLIAGYNYARYGRVDHYGYTILESRAYNVTNEYRFGSYSWRYAPRHFAAALWSFPQISPHPPYATPNMMSMALWIVTPAIFLALGAPRRSAFARASIGACLFLLPGTILHGGVGASQFGYRYMLDYLPFILILMALALRERIRPWQQGLIVLSILVNVWGVVVLV
jgi:hypothetical protein